MEKRTKYMLLLVIFLLFVFVVTNGYSYAKYVSNSVWNYYLETKGFYFTSEQLGTNKIVNVDNNWDFGSVFFSLKNSENGNLVSDYDIEYTVKCTIQNDASSYSKCVLNGTDSDTFNGVISSSSICRNNINSVDVSSYIEDKCKADGYEWVVQENYKDLYFDVVKTGEVDLDYVSVLIEVTSTVPYSKTLLGEFNLSSINMIENSLKVSYKEFNNYSRVVLSNSYDENKCVKLNWNSNNLRIDEINDGILSYQYDNNGYINEIKLNIDKKDSVSYVFYKTDFSKTYGNQDFSLIETNDC